MLTSRLIVLREWFSYGHSHLIFLIEPITVAPANDTPPEMEFPTPVPEVLPEALLLVVVPALVVTFVDCLFALLDDLLLEDDGLPLEIDPVAVPLVVFDADCFEVPLPPEVANEPEPLIELLPTVPLAAKADDEIVSVNANAILDNFIVFP